MAVGSYTYGTVALVHDRIGWVVPGRAAFSVSTIPTEAEVEALLDSVASEIHALLAESGYPVDTKASVTTSAARAVSWLEMLNVTGACAQILQMFPVAGDEETGHTPENFWSKLYENGKKLIPGRFLARMGLSRSYKSSDDLVCTSYKDSDGNVKDPLFTRDMWSVPGNTAGVFASEDISYGE